MQFALANWTFLDAAILSAHAHAPYNEPDRPPPVHVTFLDWLPGICSLLGMVVVNLIDKDRVQGNEDFGDARADAARGADDAMAVMGEALLGAVAREGNTGVLADRLRGMGMGDLADKVAARDA